MSTDARIDGRPVAEALQRILSSRTFARSERLRAFLKFIVEMEQEGLAHQLKGYTIGIDVFDRGTGFDPGTDPLVRVQAGKLRKLLNQFYASEGRDEPLRILIPIGGYVPVYQRLTDAARLPQIGSEIDHPARSLASMAKRGMADETTCLPRLFIRQPRQGDYLAKVFANATRLWTNRLWAVAIAGPDERPEREGPAHPLYFELSAESIAPTRLRLDLYHLRSGREIPLETSDYDLSGDILQLGAIANQFAGRHLTIPGTIYGFCHDNGLSTGQMKCLDATYRYTLEMTDAAYLSARRCQQQWAGLASNSEIITEMSKLIAISAAAPGSLS